MSTDAPPLVGAGAGLRPPPAGAITAASRTFTRAICNRFRPRDSSIRDSRTRHVEFLERLVLKLLVRMGYGGLEAVTEHLGGPGDQGLDGLIRQDLLGLDVVYVQAKRYATDRKVGRPDIQGFVGALHG